MKTKPWFNSRMLAALGLVMLLILAACGQEPRLPDPVDPGTPPPTTGSLSVNVAGTPEATVTVTGPGGFSQERTTPATFTNLAPGTYTITPQPREGYTTAPAQAVVTAGEHTNVTITYVRDIEFPEPPPPPTEPDRGAYYRGADGQLVRIDDDAIDAGRFVFMTWLEDQDGGVDVGQVGVIGQPGMPTADEMDEVAPSWTQNLAVAYMGYRADDGNIYPVVNATVRWTFDDTWAEGTGHMDFGTTSNGGNNCGFIPAPITTGELEVQCIDNRQADTTTNSGTVRNAIRFPVTLPGAVTGRGGDYPLYNVTGVNTPDTDGLSWVTLFSLDQRAAARLSVVGYVNGNEIAKRSVIKRFAPLPRLEIEKTVDPSVVEVGENVTFNVTVRNVGEGDAFGVRLEDRLSLGNDANYSITAPAGTTPVGDSGFDSTFNLAAGASQTFTFTARATAIGEYCNIARVVAGQDEFGRPVRGLPIQDEACFLVIAPQLDIDKQFVDAQGNAIGSERVVQLGQEATLRVRLTNTGTGPARGVNVTDRLIEGNDAFYSISNFPEGATAVGDSGWNYGPFDLAAGATRDFFFTVVTTEDGRYCDRAAFTSINAGEGFDDACLIVVTPAQLQITKTVEPNVTEPGQPVTFTVTVTNTGPGNARNVVLQDRLQRGNDDAYSITAPAGTEPVGDSGFNTTFDLDRGQSRTFTFPATATAVGEYCNIATVVQFEDARGVQVVNISDIACFVVVQPILDITKQIRDPATGTWRDTVEVAQNQPAEVRVVLTNTGTGTARNVNVTDRLISGNDANYSITQFPEGTTAFGDSGWDFGPIDLAAGASRTFNFTVVATADGDYCDRAAFTSDNAGVGQDDACLIVRMPRLEITKTNSPMTVNPGGTYTSTITVTNVGTAPARNVVISDRIGLGPEGTYVEYVSSNLAGTGGTFSQANQTVSFPARDIAAGESVTVTVTQRVPDGAPAGQYCDIAAFTSANAGQGQAEACIIVPAFAAVQTQMVDNPDPVVGQLEELTYTSAMYVEPRSNQGVTNNVFDFTFGLPGDVEFRVNGLFTVDHARTTVFFLENPPRDPVTGQVSMTPGAAGAQQLVTGVDYNITTTAQGRQIITMNPSFILEPNSVIYVRHFLTIPAGTPQGRYQSSFAWDHTVETTTQVVSAFSSEPTNVQSPNP